MKESYQVHVVCKNCETEDYIEIEKGVRVAETPCPNCGCYELKAQP